MKIKFNLNILLNIFLLVLITTLSYSWMMTQRSQGELIDYDRNLIITSSDITVKAYAFVDNQYVEQTTSPIFLKLAEPGALQQYRFDLTNNNLYPAKVKVVLANITGDIALLDDYITVGSTSPNTFSYLLKDGIMYNAKESRHYLDLFDEITIPASQTLPVYVYLSLDENATNDIQDLELSIDKIMFIRP